MSKLRALPILPYPKQPVTCAPYDPRAPEVAATLADLITALLPTVTVEHFGSTAVPCCAGKGVIDLMVLYHVLPIETVLDQLDRLGFQWVQRQAHLPEEWPKGMGAVSYMGTVFRLHIHVLPREHPMVITNRAFRDQLRNDPALVAAYVARKRTLIEMGTTEPIAYTQAKMPFITSLIRQGNEHMQTVNDSTTDQQPEKRHQQYLVLANHALQHYALGVTIPTFIQHNAGIVFRVEAPTMGRHYLLKLHARRGDGPNPSAAQLEVGLCWLAGIARETDVVVQTPVATTTGQFVCQVASNISEPINCSLQYWIEGEAPNGDFTLQQIRQLGLLMAKLHAHSQHHPLLQELPALHYDASALAASVHTLRTALDTTLLSPQAYAVLVAAQARIAALITDLGIEPEVWGAVHGDLHHGNVLLYQDEIRPVDFTGLCLAHYLYDIGVTLYHIYHQGSDFRRAFLEGYQQIQHLPEEYLGHIEAFVTYAAIDTIAWNSTIAEQACSALFQRNLQQLIDTFCTHLAKGQSFMLS